MKCQWKECTGLIDPKTGLCLMCGHSLNIALEEEIERKKAEAKGNCQTLHSNQYAKERKIRRKYSTPET